MTEENQDLTDEKDLDELMKELNAEEVPDSVKALDTGDKDAQGEASHAFAKEKRKQKEAAKAIEELRKKNEELTKRVKPEEKPNAPTPPYAGGNAAEMVLNVLTLQAMQNTGISQPKTLQEQKVLEMEVQRLYNLQATKVEETTRVAQKSEGIINEKLSGFAQLSDEDRAEVKKRLGKYEVLRQVDDDVIVGEVTRYLGEKVVSGTYAPAQGGNGDEGAEGAKGKSPDAAAAVSTVKQGRKGVGVEPGRSAAQEGDKPKPPSAEEVREMRKLGFVDVVLYRKAKDKSNKYKGKAGIV